MEAMEPTELTAYSPPIVTDFGDLVALTAACIGSGALDHSFPAPGDPFTSSSPAFGDPSFCTP